MALKQIFFQFYNVMNTFKMIGFCIFDDIFLKNMNEKYES